MTTTTRTFYSFRDISTGELVRLCEDNSGWSLSRYKDYPVFEVSSAFALSKTLRDNTFWMNSTANCPSWGEFRREELLPVQVSVTTEDEPVELEPFFLGDVLDKRRTLPQVAKLYTGVALEPYPGDELHLWVVRLGKGESIESLAQRHVVDGNLLHLPYYSFRVYFVCEVPEELYSADPGKELALLVVSRELPHPGER
jgi:hypothetical protein